MAFRLFSKFRSLDYPSKLNKPSKPYEWIRHSKVNITLEDARKGPGDFISDHLDSASARFYENTAVVVGSETWTRKHSDGSTFQGQFIWTDTWIKRNNLWQIVQAEDITVPCDAK